VAHQEAATWPEKELDQQHQRHSGANEEQVRNRESPRLTGPGADIFLRTFQNEAGKYPRSAKTQKILMRVE
jgi:hypothetical protein